MCVFAFVKRKRCLLSFCSLPFLHWYYSPSIAAVQTDLFPPTTTTVASQRVNVPIFDPPNQGDETKTTEKKTSLSSSTSIVVKKSRLSSFFFTSFSSRLLQTCPNLFCGHSFAPRKPVDCYGSGLFFFRLHVPWSW